MIDNNRILVWNQQVLCYCEMGGASFGFTCIRHIHCIRCGSPSFAPLEFVYSPKGTRTPRTKYYCRACWDSQWR